MSPGTLVGVLVAAVLAGDPADGYTSPPEGRGEARATLAVRVARGPAPGQGLVALTLTVVGPLELEVEPVRLEEADAVWAARRRASSWSLKDGRVTWAQTLDLVQVKPGVVRLPGVRLRWRARPGAEWEEAKWSDLLQEPRPVPPAEELPPLPPSPWPARLRAAGLAAVAGLALVAGLVAWRRWGRSPPPPRPPQQRALEELERLRREAERDPAAATARSADVVRGYLAERFGLPAPQQTSGEFLEALAGAPQFPPEQSEALREFLTACDLVKFSGLTPLPAEAIRTAARAVALVEALGPPATEEPAGPAAFRPAGDAGQG